MNDMLDTFKKLFPMLDEELILELLEKLEERKETPNNFTNFKKDTDSMAKIKKNTLKKFIDLDD